MMSVSLNLPLEQGWKLVDAFIVSGSAIALVTLSSSSGREGRSRFDVGKTIFIDPLPVQVSRDAIDRIVAAIGRLQREDIARQSSPHW